MRTLTLIIALSLAACGAQNKDGTCKDYTPSMSCPTGHDYVCETSKDGCRQCTCVPNQNIPEAPGFDD